MRRLPRHGLHLLAALALVTPSAQAYAALPPRPSTAIPRDLAPGLKLTSFRRLEASRWSHGTILTADLTTPTLSLDVRTPGKGAADATLTQQMAGTGAVAGVNGDFFDIKHSGAPVGTDRGRGGLLNAASRASRALTLRTAAGGGTIAAISALTSRGRLTADGRSHRLNGFDTPSVPHDGLAVYGRLWSGRSLDRPMGGPHAPSTDVARATLVDGVVTEIAEGAGRAEIPAGGRVVIGREAGASVVRSLWIGEQVDIAIGIDPAIEAAISGDVQLVKHGLVGSRIGDDGVHSRTAVGISRAGTKLFVLALDGRTAASRGMTRDELARAMISLGAYDALNLDGGGSTTMAVRAPGTTEPEVVDTPSDGHERKVANSLQFFSDADPASRSTRP